MKKFLIGGVSLFAILSANNAMAAGYTCEELIEYTSCNPGYYYGSQVSGTGMVCPEGYQTLYENGICNDFYANELYFSATTEAECMAAGLEDPSGENSAEWIAGPVCVRYDEDWGEYSYTTDLVEGNIYTKTCVLCPAGSSCAGGDIEVAVATPCAAGTYQDKAGQETCKTAPAGNYVAGVGATAYTTCAAGFYQPTAGQSSCLTCDAGSYCATTGLTQTSGLCSQGSYSTGGAKTAACTPCPSSGLIDASGNAVSVTTESAGATSSSACFVAKGTQFKDDKGIYKYTEKCLFGNFNERADCEAAGETWDTENDYCSCSGDDGTFWNYDIEDGIARCMESDYVGKKSYCENEYEGTWDWDNLTCECPDGEEWYDDSDESGYCS